MGSQRDLLGRLNFFFFKVFPLNLLIWCEYVYAPIISNWLFFLSNSSKESLLTLQFVSFAGVPLPSWGLDAEVFLLSGSSTTSSL